MVIKTRKALYKYKSIYHFTITLLKSHPVGHLAVSLSSSLAAAESVNWVVPKQAPLSSFSCERVFCKENTRLAPVPLEFAISARSASNSVSADVPAMASRVNQSH